jgi:Xaa-Pro aminopeptidase
MRRPGALLACLIVLAGFAPPAAAVPSILPLRERAEVQDRWLAERLDTLVPQLMRREAVDMWILVAGEYDEDPVLATMLPATWLSARRRTILLFHDRGPERGVERLAVARYPAGSFASAWDPEREPDQWARLAAIVRERDPRAIAINVSEEFPLADGLSASNREALIRTLGPRLAGRLVAREGLGLGWLESRIAAELEAYPQILRISHAIIEEGLSEAAITPGVTTTEDLVWWYRERVAALGLASWFHPSVNVQRAEAGTFAIRTMSAGNRETIRPGDLVHVDFGIAYLGLATDTQRMAYVLRPGETEAPAGLRAGMAALARARDALVAELRPGRSGNEVLAAARARTAGERLAATFYTHPIGYHGHGAGATIGLWDAQQGVPGKGDYPVRPDTFWSIELNVEHPVPEWGGQRVRFMFEENGHLGARGFRWLDGHQSDLILIPRPRG